MNALNNQQVQKNEQNNFNKSYLTTEDWFNQSMLNLGRMSKDENYRKKVAAQATNWTKDISPQLQTELDKKAEQRASFNRQHKEFIKTLESL